MKRARKTAFVVFLLASIITVGFFTGCTKKEEKGEEGVVRLRFAYWGLAEEQATTRTVVDLFNKIHPDIRVRFEHTPFTYPTTILTQIAGGNAPDVFGIDSTMTSFIKKGSLLNLDTFLEKDKEIDINDYYSQVVEPFKYNGSLYALPNEFSTVVLFYNKDMFDEAGVAYPDDTWDWDTFLSAAHKLTKRDESGRPIQFGTIFHIALPLFIYQNGGRVYSEDNTRSVFNTTETVEAIDFFYNLSRKYHVTPTPAEGQAIDCFAAFPSGRAAMYYAGRWTVPQLRKDKKIAWSIAPLPKGKERASALCAHAIGVSAQCKYPEEAWKFIKFMAGEIGQSENGRLGNLIPSLKKVAESDVFLYDKEHPEEAKTNKIYLDSLSYVRTAWGWPINPHIPYEYASDILGTELEKIVVGLIPSGEAAENIEQKLNELIDKTANEKKRG